MAFVGGLGACRRRRGAYKCIARATGNTKLQRVADALKADLPRQYDAVTELDYSIFSRDVSFDDPVTKLQGKLMYKGMLYTIAAIRATFFNDAVFELFECEALPDENKVRTRWSTKGTTRFGNSVQLSGTDYFHLNEEGFVVRHESLWD